MNTQLEKLFTQYSISKKDRYEIIQIYVLLPSTKQQSLLQNFPALASRLHKIEEDLREERELLIGSEVDNIRRKLLHNRKIKTQNKIEDLKKEI
jgi:GTPase involved in cell partitioning and DNA repair